MHQIKVRVGLDGKIEVSVNGLAGSSCKDVTKALEKALGSTSADKATAEMHAAAQTQVHLSQGGNQ